MTATHDISQRDLRMRSREIMDAVERGETFTVTRDGREIAELVPVGRRRRFVPAAELVALGAGLAVLDADSLRSADDALASPELDDPFVR